MLLIFPFKLFQRSLFLVEEFRIEIISEKSTKKYKYYRMAFIKIVNAKVFLNGNIKFINNNNNLQPLSPIQNFTTNLISPFISQNNNTMSSEESFILWTNTVNPVFEL